jgi:hypothetical protein
MNPVACTQKRVPVSNGRSMVPDVTHSESQLDVPYVVITTGLPGSERHWLAMASDRRSMYRGSVRILGDAGLA